MAYVKKRVLHLSSGKQLKMAGISIAICPTLEIGEGFTNNILGVINSPNEGIAHSVVSNPYSLSEQDFQELADFIIGLCINFKEAIRTEGIKDPSIFRKAGV